jgi:hypothetical protein
MTSARLNTFKRSHTPFIQPDVTQYAAANGGW